MSATTAATKTVTKTATTVDDLPEYASDTEQPQRAPKRARVEATAASKASSSSAMTAIQQYANHLDGIHREIVRVAGEPIHRYCDISKVFIFWERTKKYFDDFFPQKKLKVPSDDAPQTGIKYEVCWEYPIAFSSENVMVTREMNHTFGAEVIRASADISAEKQDEIRKLFIRINKFMRLAPGTIRDGDFYDTSKLSFAVAHFYIKGSTVVSIEGQITRSGSKFARSEDIFPSYAGDIGGTIRLSRRVENKKYYVNFIPTNMYMHKIEAVEHGQVNVFKGVEVIVPEEEVEDEETY